MDNHRRPRILLGITGSVAAVKGPRLALRLANEVRADVKVVLSRTVEQNFWKEGKAVASYDDESWREFLAATSAISEEGKADGDNYEDWRSSKGSISIHCKWKMYVYTVESFDLTPDKFLNQPSYKKCRRRRRMGELS